MSEEEDIPDTADRAVRGWIVAIGFTLVLVGGEMMAEKDGARTALGAILLVAALPVYLSAAWWRMTKEHLSGGQLSTLRMVASDTRWWFGLLAFVLVWLAVSPYAQQRWPFWSQGSPSTNIVHEPVSSEPIEKAIAPIRAQLDEATRQRDAVTRERDNLVDQLKNKTNELEKIQEAEIEKTRPVIGFRFTPPPIIKKKLIHSEAEQLVTILNGIPNQIKSAKLSSFSDVFPEFAAENIGARVAVLPLSQQERQERLGSAYRSYFSLNKTIEKLITDNPQYSDELNNITNFDRSILQKVLVAISEYNMRSGPLLLKYQMTDQQVDRDLFNTAMEVNRRQIQKTMKDASDWLDGLVNLRIPQVRKELDAFL